MSYGFYKVLHLISIMAVYLALGAMIFHMMNGGGKKFPKKKFLMITHGIALFFILLAGFGLLARLQITQMPWPIWVWLKLAVWLVLGAITAIIYRKPKWAAVLWFVTLALGGYAAYLANFKPL